MSHLLRHRIGTPETQHRVGTAEEYVAWVRQAHVNLGGKPDEVVPSGLTLDAYVSDGRWVVQCPCGNGPSAHPEWKIAACVECGAIHAVKMHRDWKKAERMLLHREHAHQRHWFPDRETTAHLARENRAHRLEA